MSSTTEPSLRIDARWIIPVVPRNSVLERHSLIISGEHIIDCLPTSAADVRYPNVPKQVRGQHVLLPGWVNSHTHAAMTLLRGLGNDLPLMEWLERHIWPAEARQLSPEFVGTGCRLAFAEMLLGGTTTANDMYFFPEAAASAAVALGLRVCLGLVIVEFPTPYANDADHYFRLGLESHDRLRDHPLITTAWAPHAPYTVSDHSLSRIAMLAEELDIPIHMHVHETADEVVRSEQSHGRRPLARLAELELLSPRLLAVHMTQLTPQEIALCAEHGVSVVHCPESNLKLASGACSVVQLLDQGINVALGTDGAASNNDLDMLGEIRTAALLAKLTARDATALPAHAALELATMGGARALGLERRIGSLEPGKLADIIAIDLHEPATQPVYDVAAQVVYAASRKQVSDVWVGGSERVRTGELVGFDVNELLVQAQAWGLRIAAVD